MPIRWPWRVTRADRLELLEHLAARAITLSYELTKHDNVVDPEETRLFAHLWDLHDIASQYEVYEHQRALGFPPRPGGLPRYPTYTALCEQWARQTKER